MKRSKVSVIRWSNASKQASKQASKKEQTYTMTPAGEKAYSAEISDPPCKIRAIEEIVKTIM